METIGIRRYYIDDLEMSATVSIGLKSKQSKEGEYFALLHCSEKEIKGMCKEELFRFFNDEPRLHLAHKVIKEMVIYWCLGIINNVRVSNANVTVYKGVGDENCIEVTEGLGDFIWCDINSVSIDKATYSIKDILVEESPISNEPTYCVTGDTHGDLDFKVFYAARRAGIWVICT